MVKALENAGEHTFAKLGEGGRKSDSYSEAERLASAKRLAKVVEVNGIRYKSIQQACEKLDVSSYKLHRYFEVKQIGGFQHG